MGAESTFAGRSVVVTGGASGIGRALSRKLIRRGASVTVADLDAPAAESAATELGRRAVPAALDVRDRAAFAALLDEVIVRTGGIDVLFNNAGVAVGGPTHELCGAHWDACDDVNLGGVINGVLAAYPAMVRQGHGRNVNTASAAGLVAPPLVAPYATTKHAVVGLSRALRPEAARHGVHVQVLCPGAVETPILDRRRDDLPPTASETVTARQYLRLLRQSPISAERFARAALDAVARNRSIIVVPRRASALWYLDRLSPTITDRLNRTIAGTVMERLVHPAVEAD